MKYGDLEGLAKKDPFKKGFMDVFTKTEPLLRKQKLKVVLESLGEPAALIEFMDDNFYLAFKTDGVGTKSLIADKMRESIRKNKKKMSVSKLYEGLGVDLVASNMNDLICLGARPIALSDEIAAGNFKHFADKDIVKGLYKGLIKGCLEAQITIPSGESPSLVDIVADNAISMTGSAIGIIQPKENLILGQNLKEGDLIFGMASSGVHTNGLSLARRLVENLPDGYFTRFGQKTVGEELLTPTKIYVKPILEMLEKKIKIRYMTHISGSSFRKVMRAKKEFSYVIEKVPEVPEIMTYLGKLGKLPNKELYQTWNMGIGFVLFSPPTEKKKIEQICKKHKVQMILMGHLEKGKKQVIIKPKSVVYTD